jgi:peptide deformylase
MTTLQIKRHPDPVLKQVCTPLALYGHETQTLIGDLLETMYENKGVGLAAPQVGFPVRAFVVDVDWVRTGRRDNALVFVNPTLTYSTVKRKGREGCLSLPGVHEQVERTETVVVSARNARGIAFEAQYEGFLAVAIQHEFDHLNGVTMLQHLSPLTRKFALKSLQR